MDIKEASRSLRVPPVCQHRAGTFRYVSSCISQPVRRSSNWNPHVYPLETRWWMPWYTCNSRCTDLSCQCCHLPQHTKQIHFLSVPQLGKGGESDSEVHDFHTRLMIKKKKDFRLPTKYNKVTTHIYSSSSSSFSF